MLTELRISNFALIDQLHLEFPSGFLAFTGETGAGKSLLIDALVLLTGGRASADHIRFGADEAVLEACFALQPAHQLIPRLKEEGYIRAGQSEIVVRRILSRSGKNRSYLNGQLASIQTIQDIGQQLVDIHGQHDQQSLLAPKNQLRLVDAYGDLGELVERYQKAHGAWGKEKSALEEFLSKLKDQAARQDILQFQYDELATLDLQPGEEESLNQEYQRLKHHGRLGELTNRAFTLLYDSERSVLDQLGEVTHSIQELAQIDSGGESWLPVLETATIALREVTDTLRGYRSDMEYDPERMAVIDGRLAAIQRVKKKYGKTLDELLELSRTLAQDLALLQDSDEQMVQRQAEVDRRFEAMKGLAEELSTKRRKVAQQLIKEIKRELVALKMGVMDVRINIETGNPGNPYGSTGVDRLEILLAPNPGEPFMPLGKIVSGGELSRIMLALKTVFAGNDQTPVVIFDEIDSGIGGEAGIVMGKRLRQLSQFHQVCCLTHLPQIASHAHAQFVVEKVAIDNRTHTQVQEVTGLTREIEIARMLGGGSLTTTIRKTAEELLRQGAGLNARNDAPAAKKTAKT